MRTSPSQPASRSLPFFPDPLAFHDRHGSQNQLKSDRLLGPFVSVWDWIAEVVIFPAAVAILGTMSVLSLYIFGYVFAVLLTLPVATEIYIIHSRRLGRRVSELSGHAEAVITEWTVNIFLILTDCFLVYAKATGILWGTRV